MAEPSILDARLAEIDRRLRKIQSGLEPVADDGSRSDPPEPPPLPPPAARVLHPAPEPPPAADDRLTALADRLQELATMHERLLATTQDLLVEQADVVSRAAPTLGVCAGPFTDTAALHDFRRALSELPQVREVVVREYAGAERAILDVLLAPPTA